LAEGIQNEHPDLPRDAICVFLHLHFCVCSKAESSSIGPILALNRRFVGICLARIQNARSGHTAKPFLTEKWRRALEDYKVDGRDYVNFLARVIIAHIFDDLVESLLNTWSAGIALSKEQFDRMTEHIEACLDEEFRRAPLSEDIKSKVLFRMGKFARMENVTIRILRNAAWRRAERLAQTER
jgi:hypothetical protein